MRFIIWIINFTNIEENGVCNSINNITINIPKILEELNILKTLAHQKLQLIT